MSQSSFEHQTAQQQQLRNSSPLSWLSSANLIQTISSDCSQSQATLASRCTCPTQGGADQTVGEPMIDLGFIKALLTNPLIIMSLLALAVNLIHGPELPKFVTKVSSTIAASFAAPALLVVGLSMHGKFKLILSNPSDLMLASALVITKGLVLPNIMRSVMQAVLPLYVDPKDTPSLVDFSYLYGLLPTAPGACIIAKQYEVLTNVVSLSMLLSTIFSAPLMLGTSGIISRASSITPEIILQTTSKVLTVSSSVTLVLSLLTMYLIWKSSGHATQFITGAMRGAAMLKSRFLFTILLTLTQVLVGIGGLLWLFVDLSKIKLDPKQLTLLIDDDAVKTTTSILWHRASPDYEPDDEAIEDKQQLFAGAVRPHGLLSVSSGPSITSLACTVGFVHASGGLILTRFLIGCIVIVNFARASRGYQRADQLSTLIMRSFPLVVTLIVVCLVFDSNHLTCKPTEPSLPRWPFSLHTRLIFNAVLFFITMCMFVMTLRLRNKTISLANLRDENAKDNHSSLANTTSTLIRNTFVASSSSLTSGTSSQITTSTSIDTNALNGHRLSQVTLKSANIRQNCGLESDNDANLLIDCNRLLSNKLDSVPGTGIFKTQDNFICEMQAQGYDEMASEVDQINEGHACGQICDLNNNSNQLEDFINVRSSTPLKSHDNSFIADGRATVPEQAEPGQAPMRQDLDIPIESSVDRNSILIVFMMLQTLLSITSIVQILFQDGATGGTFIMVELTNLVVDFGQGLVTFLVVGVQALPKSNFRLQSTDRVRV